MRKSITGKTAPKNISVFLRVRPPVPREAKCTFNNISYDAEDPRKITVARKSGQKTIEKTFVFNKVFQPKTSQKTVYDEFARGAVDAAFDGQHGVLFVYGQTGSGKTYTMSNEDPENPGVLQQGLQEVWRRIHEDTEHEYTCSVSYVQLYNEILTDLLDAQKGRVRIQLGPEGRGDVVLVAETSGLGIEKQVQTYEETMELFRIGMSRKEMTSTMMNNTSSRSHTIFSFNITRATKVKTVTVSDDVTTNTAPPTIALEGRLVICDLAGSERVSKTQAEGKTLDEATHINGSLLVLGKVVAALTEKNSQHAPFRESKLTRILQYSLLGNGNTSIVVNCSPADDSTEETMGAILFGQRAIQIKQEAKRHEVLDYKALYLQLLAELDSKNDGTLENALSEEREVYEERIRALEDRVKILTAENDLLRQESASLSGGGDGNPDTTNTAWHTMSKQLRNTLTERDEKIRTINDERFKLAILLAEEKRTVFRLAEKLRATMIRYQMESDRWVQRMDELGTELAKVKGTDYIGFQPADAAAESSTSTPVTPQYADPNGMSQTTGHEEVYLQEQLEKAYQRIRSLNQERIDLIVYQSRAEKAIRLLHAEKTALTKKLSQEKEKA
ncbi:putative kinesin [Trypanosoma theileri]|uniref:Kinesin-like protein n=1 Tax=Trypanosoma theileri TaxID=67003 RepID=A0A1X0P2B6_9TRYP|nr:putative kinesin [Trypanosoma theileri]ORC91052.1 putative kinesin [Trypanosoma theileri]